MTTAADELSAYGMPALTWQNMKPGGNVLIDTITKSIDRSTTVIAEVSTMNRNVLFEAGYALAKNKRLLFAMDESLESARRLWEGVQLFSTIGRLDYHGNGNYLAQLIRDTVASSADEDTLLIGILAEAKPQQMNAVFAPTVPVRFQAADMLDKELGNRGNIRVLASGDDLGLAPLSYYAGEISRSAAAIFHLMNADRTRGTEHNARSSFLAGFAYGWDLPVLMVAESEYISPLDYRDLLFNYSTAAQMVRHVDEWLSTLPLKPGSSRRLGRLTMDLDLPVSSFGQYVAENEDSRLDDYFIQTSEFTSLVDGTATVFVGRKGTGKTATMLQAAADLEKDRRNLVVKVKPTSYELAGLVDLVGRFELHAGSEYLLNNLWNFLLSTEVACRVIGSAETHAAGIGGSAELIALDHRLDRMGVDKTSDLASRLEDTVSHILEESATVHDDRELKKIVGAALSVHSFKDLHREIRDAASNNYERIAVLVDNLDKAWERGANFEATSRFLLALLSAAGQFRKALLRGSEDIALTLGVFIRSDIYEVMTEYAREPDKIGPLTVHWNDPYLLARVLEERYSTNRRRRKSASDDMWSSIFPEEVNGLPTRDYILWRILPRPRDIIYFGNAALTTAINRHHSMITQDDIAMADETYSRFAYDALVVESDAQKFDLEEVLFEFAGLNATLTSEELQVALNPLAHDSDQILSWLLRTSFLGIEVREGKFAHVEGQSEVDRKLRVARRSSERSTRPVRFRVHPAFRHYLDIRDDDLHAPGFEDVTLKSDGQ
ncbi:P-loop ATPase, Sll1717 family [Mycolicibacterium fortuitum]|nr:hypothetical protein [Mycolicibacterium fortuitum]MCA4753279.1 hypothetical protein [Mycolicibacterium fortuitum]MDG5774039.1 hypothetical protein [Mycolicibacterium fortuitum]MDG5779297.1 hypothetical protein [Mycolicibacterium fortuitum]OBK63885.1 hypothetical protein A5654_23110 [Mycolicibacterium fortuitum]